MYSVMQLPDVEDLDEVVETIAGDDRYGAAVKIYEQSSFATAAVPPDTLILAPGQQESLCMLGNHLSRQLSAPLLLVKEHSVPDIVERSLGDMTLSRVILVGGEPFIAGTCEAKVRKLAPNAEIVRIAGDTPHDVAINLHETFGCDGTLAALTWDGCTYDILSLFPYTLPAHGALFYLREDGVIDGKLRTILESGHFTTLLAVGNETPLPNELLATLPNDLTIETIGVGRIVSANALNGEVVG